MAELSLVYLYHSPLPDTNNELSRKIAELEEAKAAEVSNNSEFDATVYFVKLISKHANIVFYY